MANYQKHFKNLIEDAGKAMGFKIKNMTSDSDGLAFDINGYHFIALVIDVEGGARCRIFFDIINCSIDMEDGAKIIEATQIMNSFNLEYGGLYNFVFLENEGLMVALKAVDIVAAEGIYDNRGVKEYHKNLFAHILGIVNGVDYIKENYIDPLEDL